MKPNGDEEFRPLCRFGPGGDFIRDWSADLANDRQVSSNKLSDVLKTLEEIIAAVVGPQQKDTAGAAGKYKQAGKVRFNAKVSTSAKTDSQRSGSHSSSVGSSSGHIRLQGQALLFADDSRACVSNRCKPKHRVRTHKRAAKKASGLKLPGQGTLFEAEVASAKIA